MLSRTLNALETAYSELNKELFNGNLPDACITIQHASKKSKYTVLGWFDFGTVWSDENGTEMFEINITSDALNRNYIDTIGTLVHEMVHLYCYTNGIEDMKGKKHNESFKAECENVGLIVEKDKSVGWGITTVSLDLRNKILDLDISEDDFSNTCQLIIEEKPPKPKKPKTYYICPECNEKINSKKPDLNILCGKCHRNFELVIEDIEN